MKQKLELTFSLELYLNRSPLQVFSCERFPQNCFFTGHVQRDASKLFNTWIYLNIHNNWCCYLKISIYIADWLGGKCESNCCLCTQGHDVSDNNRQISCQWKGLQRMKEDGGSEQTTRVRELFLKEICYFLKNESLVISFLLGMVQKLLCSWKNVAETSYSYYQLYFVETTRLKWSLPWNFQACNTMNLPKTEHKKPFHRIAFIRLPSYHSLMINQIITFFWFVSLPCNLHQSSFACFLSVLILLIYVIWIERFPSIHQQQITLFGHKHLSSCYNNIQEDSRRWWYPHIFLIIEASSIMVAKG